MQTPRHAASAVRHGTSARFIRMCLRRRRTSTAFSAVASPMSRYAEDAATPSLFVARSAEPVRAFRHATR